MKLAFSTLGCPGWKLPQIAETAHTLGYQGIELRALGGSLNLLEQPELRPDTISETRRFLDDRDLAVCCIDTSCTFDSMDQGRRQENIETALRHCELAAAIGAPLIRVFPDRVQPGATREETRKNISACIGEVARRAPDGVRVGLETHGDFAYACEAAEVARLSAHPNVALIWDVANALSAGGSIEESAQAVAPYLAHVHLRDARATEGDNSHWLPVLAGTGAVSFAATVAALDHLRYDGFISFEWEKYWHPEIEEPEIALPNFIEAMRRVVQSRVSDRSTDAA